VWSPDPLTVAGIEAALDGAQGMTLLPVGDLTRARVVVVADYTLGESAVALVGKVASVSPARVVLVADSLTEADLRAVSQATVAVLPRSSVTPDVLVAAVRKAGLETSGGRIGDMVERVGPGVLRPLGGDRIVLTRRERDVLTLLVDGEDTAAIAALLYCSERTVKSEIRHVVDRLGMRNRAHAVAYAVREGLV
jgi:DNA-binding NarL/FixJ family response regulator